MSAIFITEYTVASAIIRWGWVTKVVRPGEDRDQVKSGGRRHYGMSTKPEERRVHGPREARQLTANAMHGGWVPLGPPCQLKTNAG